MQIKLVANPVVYTNNAGGDADKLQAPVNGENYKDFDAGGEVLAAWWSPYDNLGDLGAIHRIAAEPQGDEVRLRAGGINGQRDARVRIRIYALVNP